VFDRIRVLLPHGSGIAMGKALVSAVELAFFLLLRAESVPRGSLGLALLLTHAVPPPPAVFGRRRVASSLASGLAFFGRQTGPRLSFFGRVPSSAAVLPMPSSLIFMALALLGLLFAHHLESAASSMKSTVVVDGWKRLDSGSAKNTFLTNKVPMK
jgi:hypothetical protein